MENDHLIDWSEVAEATCGSNRWRKGAAFVSCFCEVLLQPLFNLPVSVGAGDDSSYGPKEPGSDQFQVVIEKRLLEETTLGNVRLDRKLCGMGSVLAHELAHHVISHSDEIDGICKTIAGTNHDRKQSVLDSLEAYNIAQWTGASLTNIAHHWGAPNSTAEAEHVTEAVEKIDQAAISEPERRIVRAGDLRGIKRNARHNNAHEWLAAVLGFLVFYRLNRGPKYVGLLIKNFEGLTEWANGPILNILKVAEGHPEAERLAEAKANEVLESCNLDKVRWDRISGLTLVQTPLQKRQ